MDQRDLFDALTPKRGWWTESSTLKALGWALEDLQRALPSTTALRMHPETCKRLSRECRGSKFDPGILAASFYGLEVILDHTMPAGQFKPMSAEETRIWKRSRGSWA